MDAMHTQLNAEQLNAVTLLKRMLPFRVVGAALHPETGEFRTYARSTRSGLDRLARKGWLVWIAE